MKITISALGLLFSITAFAQPKEYIIKQNGDTVKGGVKILAKQIKVIRALNDTITFNSEEAKFYVKTIQSKQFCV